MFKNFLAATVATLGASAAIAQAASAPVVAATAAETGLIAGLFGFVMGWSFVILIVLALLGIIAEHNGSSGWSVFWMILAGAVGYFAFKISLVALAIGAVAYIFIGLFWSFWRYKRHAAKVVEKHRDDTQSGKERALAQLHPKAMLGTITSWIVIWPFSLIENIVGDLITAIQMLVTKFFRGVYHKVYDSAVAALR